MIVKSGLLEAKVYHKRHRPVIHELFHKVFYLVLKLSKTNTSLEKWFFSINKFNLFSLFWKDYGFKTFEDPKTYIQETLESFHIKSSDVTDVLLVTMPRVLGYAFNPVSFWLCFNSNQLLCAVLAEVNNTFGERHGYLCFNENMTPITNVDHIYRPKVFHVSPFCEVKGEYQFQFAIDSKVININIDYYEGGEKLISTSIKGKRTELIDKNLIKYFFTIPLITLKVILLIHYHALCLWMKKVRYIKKPAKPDIDIT